MPRSREREKGPAGAGKQRAKMSSVQKVHFVLGDKIPLRDVVSHVEKGAHAAAPMYMSIREIRCCWALCLLRR